ncbi:hypothetical protein [uncultured Endozoicomonas sp.]|uniref:hypothetical protein n=1 Tax=uncultured Endozoicomonas sp. TaxID=432652 RepID=UPI00260F0B2A|nr:hypothetical protein [uncultured Endozoicomonas sp.]
MSNSPLGFIATWSYSWHANKSAGKGHFANLCKSTLNSLKATFGRYKVDLHSAISKYIVEKFPTSAFTNKRADILNRTPRATTSTPSQHVNSSRARSTYENVSGTGRLNYHGQYVPPMRPPTYFEAMGIAVPNVAPLEPGEFRPDA